MVETYQVEQALAVGPGATVKESQIKQTKIGSFGESINFDNLENILENLLEKMQTSAVTPDQRAEMETVEKAKNAAKKKDRAGIKKALIRMGKWTLETAQAIGIGLTIEALKKGL